MKKTIILKSPELRERARAIIDNLPVEPVHEVIIKEHKRDLSAEQRALYFVWLGVVGAELGYTKEELHLDYKERFLVPIYMRDNESYLEMIQSVKVVRRRGMNAEADTLKKFIIKETSIMDANTKQMSEYMDDIDKLAASLDIRLPLPEQR